MKKNKAISWNTIASDSSKEVFKANNGKIIFSIVAYFILGMNFLSIDFIIFIPYVIVASLLTSMSTTSLFIAISIKKYKFESEDEFNEWFGGSGMVWLVHLFIISIGFIQSLIFKIGLVATLVSFVIYFLISIIMKLTVIDRMMKNYH